MLNFGSPIRIFYANLLRIGVTLRVVRRDGEDALRIGGSGRANLSPVYREEIVRRASQLIELLSPPIPGPLRPYSGRLLSVVELESALEIAKQMNVKTAEYPANGGWILLLGAPAAPQKQEA